MYCFSCDEQMTSIGPGVYRCERCGAQGRDTSRRWLMERCEPVSLETMQNAAFVPNSVFLSAPDGRITRLPPRDNVREICFSEGVRIIEKEALMGFRNLECVSFPETLQKISKRSFYGCRKLRIAFLPFGTKKIGKKAFRKTQVHLQIPPPFARISPSAFPKKQSEE